MLRRKHVPQPNYVVTRAATSRGLGTSKYFGAQDVGSYFGGQDKNLSLGSTTLLSNNEKALLAVGVIGIVGWFAFGSKIKKALR